MASTQMAMTEMASLSADSIAISSGDIDAEKIVSPSQDKVPCKRNVKIHWRPPKLESPSFSSSLGLRYDGGNTLKIFKDFQENVGWTLEQTALN